MISSLTGKIIQKTESNIVLNVNGVGYLVSVPLGELLELNIDEEITLNTYLVVKEDALDLYGSKNKEILDWFKMLLQVKGVGPKSALTIISKASAKDLSAAIQSESSDILVSVGVGKKAAERVVMELKNKAKDLVGEIDEHTHKTVAVESEAIQALEALGYSREQARDALSNVEGEGVEEKIKSALQVLGK